MPKVTLKKEKSFTHTWATTLKGDCHNQSVRGVVTGESTNSEWMKFENIILPVLTLDILSIKLDFEGQMEFPEIELGWAFWVEERMSREAGQLLLGSHGGGAKGKSPSHPFISQCRKEQLPMQLHLIQVPLCGMFCREPDHCRQRVWEPLLCLWYSPFTKLMQKAALQCLSTLVPAHSLLLPKELSHLLSSLVSFASLSQCTDGQVLGSAKGKGSLQTRRLGSGNPEDSSFCISGFDCD